MSQGAITPKQQEILNFIRDNILMKGYPPSVREICDAVGLKSTSSVHSHLDSLEQNGYIRRDPTKPRAIEILDDEYGVQRRDMVSVPILGSVAAGAPILAEENIEGYYPVPADMLPRGPVFMLNVHGDSMVNAGILDGDQVICEQESTAENGQIVVALIDDSATVKRFYKEKDHVRLQPENDFMEPIIVTDVRILGRVIGLIRMHI